MIDVSKFARGQACPRCADRRVYAIDQDKNLWLCVPNAVVTPWHRSQVTEHDAAEFVEQEETDRGLGLTQETYNQTAQVIHGRR